ncbi:gliding motility-associated C-terminal domain-containing protein [Flavobacterium sp. CYK-4]|uniref:gliding motility-associated C-terminal domain-containing protein n=1 Tax=Flavobacterium lotistagni TaxID=2709660 RepID=UPI00140C112C|nr:gliding motility-associated C-terminal domain-containing protein [Flavobacterium lotistagni]NHM08161.1 gliding motility-associated C-terminal domain-containing protein [Flavobacterium lotistagni]
MGQIKLVRQIILWGFLLTSLMLRAQLADFSLQVTPVTESCTANGRLNFQVTNTTVGATVLYTIYRLPNTTVPIAVTDENTLTGLVSATYRVVATQSLGDLSNSQQQEVFITDTIIDLSYTLQTKNEICGNDGRITITITNSVAVSYEIFAGPVIRPLQTSNIFENLPAGNYNVRVFDACGEGVARTATVTATPPGLAIGGSSASFSGCNNLSVSNSVYSTSGHVIAYPLTIQITAFSPTGPPLIFNDSNPAGSAIANSFNFTVPVSYTSYNVKVLDGCGYQYNQNNLPITLPVPRVNLTSATVICDIKNLNVSGVNMTAPLTIQFLSAPAGFDPLVFNANHLLPFNGSRTYYNASIPLPEGSYTVKLTDACGRTATGSRQITPSSPGTVAAIVYPGCESDRGGIIVTGVPSIVSGELIIAPAGYPFTLPQDLSNYFTGSTISMGSLIPGTYVFRTVNSCGQIKEATAQVVGLTSGPATATITENCDSFNIAFRQQTNARIVSYWMQKFYPATNQWGHPITGYIGTPNQVNQSNAYVLNISGTNTNIQSSGQFRVVRRLLEVEDGEQLTSECLDVVYNFEYYVGPRILSVYSFECENSLYDAVVIAQGYGPLKYRITAKNGQPFFVNNNFSNIFLGLEPTVYNFQIEDACGNILNSLFDISNPSLFPIAATPFCEGQSGSLSVPGYDFLHYEWRKGNNPTVIATTNTLNFPNFSAAANNGTYFVRVYYDGNPNSCVDFTVNYQINVSTTAPNAGAGQNVAYCGPQGVVDLFSLLSGDYDSNGVWSETSNSGSLVQNLWDSSAIVNGNFLFQYTVNGSCGQSDQSNVGIVIHPQPQTPIASLEQVVCDSQTIQLAASAIPFGDYFWTGPNGFTSSEQNPSITNVSIENQGIYTVNSQTADCQSGQTNIEIVVNALPQFTLEKGCLSGQYTLSVNPENKSFDGATANYSWTGPEGFTSSENPVRITGLPGGTYGVTVTNAAGCATEASIAVLGTQCSIPNVITPNGDTVNDVFDLSGLVIRKLEIYNRWGRLVFNQNNYTNQWHGQNNNGDALADSTYYYIAYLATGEEKQGWVFVTGNH